jgi:hypothetical protein
MSGARPHFSSRENENSDALADIALNTLGLTLILMLIYILLFRQTTQKIAHAAHSSESRVQALEHVAAENKKLREELAAADVDQVKTLRKELDELKANAVEHAEEISDGKSELAILKSKLEQEQAQLISMGQRLKAASDLSTALTSEKTKLTDRIVSLQQDLTIAKESQVSERENARRLQSQVRELETRIDSIAKGGQLSGIWRFRNHVVKLVDHNDNAESVDWTIDYFIFLNVVDGKVTGTLFGAHEVETDDQAGHTASFAEITGTISKSGFLDVELEFSAGSADSGSEHLRCQFGNNEFVGRLESGRHRDGYRNYVGPTRGTRLTESVFQE